jgi:hypothetical protein
MRYPPVAGIVSMITAAVSSSIARSAAPTSPNAILVIPGVSGS